MKNLPSTAAVAREYMVKGHFKNSSLTPTPLLSCCCCRLSKTDEQHPDEGSTPHANGIVKETRMNCGARYC